MNLDGNRNCWTEKLQAVRPQEVEKELQNPPGRYTIDRLVRLISPAAKDFLEPMAQQARALTIVVRQLRWHFAPEDGTDYTRRKTPEKCAIRPNISQHTSGLLR